MVILRSYPERFASLLLLLTLCCSLLPGGALQAQDVEPARLLAYVDRNEISMGQTVTLTIRVDAALGNVRPQIGGLSQDFEQVGGISTRSNYTSVNGNVQSWTEYTIRLRPRRTGTLEIPSFRVDSEVTTPITITVSDTPQDDGNEGDEIFLSSSISKDEIYVQEELIYTIRIYYSVGFDQGAQLSTPEVGDAVLQQLGRDENFQEVVGGIGYNVTERRYVIYPQSSGELTIPPVYFSATVGRRGFNRFTPNRSVREINLASEQHSVTVKPRPANFPGQTWLPSSELSLEETWSSQDRTISVGDAITRNIEITAHGLSSSLLPGMDYEPVPGLRFYPDQPVREDSADRDGVIGIRREGTAIVASRPGEYELPELRLPWWNTTTDSLEVAVLPARMITVLPATGSDGEPVGDPGISGVPETSGQPGRGMDVQTDAGASPNVLWIGASIAFATAWLLTLVLWLNSRRQLAYAETMGVAAALKPLTPQAARKQKQQTERKEVPEAATALRVLKTACDSGRHADIRKALLKWGQAGFQTTAIQTLSQLADRIGDKDFSTQCARLDAAIYGGEAQGFDAKALYAMVAKLHKNGVNNTSSQDKYSLPPLYKN